MNQHLISFQRRTLPLFLACATLLVTFSSGAAGSWYPVTNTAPGGIALMLLLPNGSVMCQNGGNATWYLLTPDIHGSYLNGSWSTLAPMHDSRRYYSSQVLPSGQVFVTGGEYGTGGSKAELYTITNNVWTQVATPPDNIIDNISETLPNGNVLEGSPGDDSRIFYVASNSWSSSLKPVGGQDEASWVKLQDGSILTIDPFGTNVERFVPSLNQWVADMPVPVPVYGYGGELGPGLLLPNGKAIFFGASGSNVVYTPFTTNYAGTYTPAGTTNAGSWTTVATTPNFNAPIDAPAAIMVNGNILCCMTGTNNSYGSDSFFYEYNYVSNTFTAVSAPTGGSSFGPVAYGCTMLDLPDGSVLLSSGSSQLYEYRPTGTPLTNATPTILTVTTNANGSYHLTGTQLTGISEGAAYGDDSQMNSDYPLARMTNSAGNILYCRTFNWSTCNLMTGTNIVSTDLTLPAGLLAGTYPLVVNANGFNSAPYSLTINGTPLPPVVNLGFTTVASNQITLKWNAIGLTEAGYVIERSTNGANYTIVATVSSGTTNYTDTAVSALGQYYYQVAGTNVVGLGNLGSPIFTASPGVHPVSTPWSSQDVGAVQGGGATGTNGGVYTLIGAGTGIGSDNDQFQFAYEPMVGDVTITARLTACQVTGSNSVAGVMIRNSTGSDVAGAMMGFNPLTQISVFEHRIDSAGVAGYGRKDAYIPADDQTPSANGASDPGIAQTDYGTLTLTAPVWLRVTRTGNQITGFTSPDGTNWTQGGTLSIPLSAVVNVGLAVSSGTYNLLNTATFDNLTVTATNSLLPTPVALWKLDEPSGTNAEDSIDSFDGMYNNCVLGLAGATPETGYSAGFNGTSANISIPALNLNSNVCTITAWVYRTTTESLSSGIFFNRANATVSGLTFDNSTANELSYTWNNNSSTYGWHSGLIVPANTWTFAALVITPTNGAIYMATNGGPLLAATNPVANAVQNFDGLSYIGQDSGSSSRYFNGQLDQVGFFNRALSRSQLAALASTPTVTFASPVAGTGVTNPGTFNLTVALAATNGHTANLVQFFNNDTLVGTTTTPPFTNAVTLTNLPAGTYNFTARLFYDSGLVVDSDPDTVFVQNAAGIPTGVAATALASNLVNIAWNTSSNATGYILYRGGSPIAALAGNSYADFGLNPGVSYCYTVSATNLVSTSAQSASSCVTTPSTGAGTCAWSAAGTVSGPQDGSGTWSTGTTAWWNGTADVAWTDGNIALIGVNTISNCTVQLADDVTPAALVFGVTGGGTYTVAGTNNLITSANLNLCADGNATVLCPLFGTNSLVKTGAGTLTVSNSSPSYIGVVTISNGAVVMLAGPSAANIGFIIRTNGALYQGYNTGPNYTKGVTIYGAGLNPSNGLHIACGVTFAQNNFTLTNGPTFITTYGSGNNAQMEGFDINGNNLLVSAASSGSIIDSTVNINVAGGYGMRIYTTLGSSNATGDLVMNGLVVGGGNTLYKYGSGSLRLANTNTYSAGTTFNAGTLQLAATNSALGAGPVTLTGNGTLQAAVSTIVSNNINVGSGYTLTLDSLTNTFTLLGQVTNSGTLTKTSAGTFALESTGNPLGTANINAGTLQVDGSIISGTLTIANNASLGGTGVIGIAPSMQSGSTLAPGDNTIGTLSFSSGLTLNSGSKTILQITKNGGVTAADQVAVTGTLAFAGSLTVTNTGTNAFAFGDSFQLFTMSGHSGNFSAVTLPALSTGLFWNTNSLLSSGLLTVAAAPGITNQPQGLMVSTGSPASFTVGATGSAPLAYQWRFNNSAIAGATAATYTLNPVLSSNAGNYTVVITNNYGSITSAVATLSIKLPPGKAQVVALPAAGFTLGITGNSGQTYYLLAATNLTNPNWIPVATNVATTNGPLQLTDPGPTNWPARFYEIETP